MKIIGKDYTRYILLIIVGIIIIYPLIWLLLASFKTNEEIFGVTTSFLPEKFSLKAYIEGWKGSGQFTYGHFFINTFKLVVPTVVFTVASSVLVAYGFARFKFPFKKILFAIMISTLMLPNAVIIIPRYILFKNLGWLDTYYPFIVPAVFACFPFFIFLVVQFIRGLPKELDESAFLDGCNSFTILTKILLPLCKPAIFSVALLQFIWTWNDFLDSLIFINSIKKFTLTLGLRMSLDAQAAVNWDQIMAMATLTIVPCIVLFFFAQKYFVEGIATTGLKG
ncbi:carbohydrate ABC transporter permease [Paenibacillus eucommiae]|uniref:Oligogalacturonide transport system permease protein n=1 Tax=Paenibacillus eucommiae TaxID=1355755 RepID=A0ABS4J9J7_9BACL|nr:carbohydrate ABC transporter permease [Paenibacillus eucommiae]MBP1996516.1 oligogalacturonide transport system permease protein [Paenibacillus eucommiae]